ncbi:ectoderm-neural cortex protein 1-like [Saccoglossus kowalevskii]
MNNIPRTKRFSGNSTALEFHDKSISHSILDGLLEFYRQNDLCDLVLTVSGYEYPCHRSVLSCVSPYFKAMFTSGMQECKTTKVPLNDVDPVALRAILDYIYTSDITINQDNAQQLLHASSMFQMQTLFQVCCSFLKTQLNSNNCFGILKLADTYTCTNLNNVTIDYILHNFCDICKNEEFMELSKDALIKYLSDRDLVVEDEELLCNALIRWIEYNKEERTKHVARLLRFVNVAKLERRYIDRLLTEIDTVKNVERAQQILECTPKTFRGHDATDSRYSNVMILSSPGNVQGSLELFDYDAIKKTLIPYGVVKDITIEGHMSSVALVDGYRTCLLNGQDSIWYVEGTKKGWVKTRQNVEHYGGTVVNIDEQLYVIENSATSADILTMKSSKCSHGDWQVVTRIPDGCCDSGIVVLNGRIFIIGGNQGCVAYNQCYDLRARTWTKLKPAPRLFSECPAVALNGFIYILGIYSTEKKTNNEVWRYDPDIDDWCQVADLSVPGPQIGAVACNGEILSFCTSKAEPEDTPISHNSKRQLHIQRYDFSHNIWYSDQCDTHCINAPDHGMCFLPYKHYKTVKVLMEKGLEHL